MYEAVYGPLDACAFKENDTVNNDDSDLVGL